MNHLVDVRGWVLHGCGPSSRLFSHGTQTLSNGLGREPISFPEVLQNTPLAAKLYQAASAHANLGSKIPAQGFEAKPPLPDPHPPVLDADDLDRAQQENGGRVSFTKRLEQRQLFIEVFARRRQHQLPVLTDLAVTIQLEAFHEGAEFLCEGSNLADRHGQSHSLCMAAEPREEPTKLFKRFRQIETGDAPARSDHQTWFRRRRQHNARYFEAFDALGGEQSGNAFGTRLPVKHQ